jgi:hypothetical protein
MLSTPSTATIPKAASERRMLLKIPIDRSIPDKPPAR